MLISKGDGHAFVYKGLKSDFYDIDCESGYCPNCQEYIRKYVEDDYLTCKRCGWKYKTLKQRIKNLITLKFLR